MNDTRKTLTDIFADTDNVCFGPFGIIKNLDETFDDARFMVDGIEVPMEADQKKVMALLIDQQGKTLNVRMLFEGLGTEHFNNASGIARPNQVRQFKAAYTEQVFFIQNAIAEVFGEDTPETARYLDAFKAVRRHALRPSQVDLKSGYRLNIYTHDSAFE